MLIIVSILLLLGIFVLVVSVSAAYRVQKSPDKELRDETAIFLKLGIGGFLLFSFLAAVVLYAVPVYKVWQQGKTGEAALAEATANRQILIQEASAKEEAAKHLAEAEIIRSHGIAKANKIVSESLKGNSMYLQYLYIQSLKESKNKVIYVPITSQGLPVLESARFLYDNSEPDDENTQVK